MCDWLIDWLIDWLWVYLRLACKVLAYSRLGHTCECRSLAGDRVKQNKQMVCTPSCRTIGWMWVLCLDHSMCLLVNDLVTQLHHCGFSLSEILLIWTWKCKWTISISHPISETATHWVMCLELHPIHTHGPLHAISIYSCTWECPRHLQYNMETWLPQAGTVHIRTYVCTYALPAYIYSKCHKRYKLSCTIE